MAPREGAEGGRPRRGRAGRGWGRGAGSRAAEPPPLHRPPGPSRRLSGADALRRDWWGRWEGYRYPSPRSALRVARGARPPARGEGVSWIAEEAEPRLLSLAKSTHTVGLPSYYSGLVGTALRTPRGKMGLLG